MSSAKQKQKTVGFEFVRITRKAVQNLFLTMSSLHIIASDLDVRDHCNGG